MAVDPATMAAIEALPEKTCTAALKPAFVDRIERDDLVLNGLGAGHERPALSEAGAIAVLVREWNRETYIGYHRVVSRLRSGRRARFLRDVSAGQSPACG